MRSGRCGRRVIEAPSLTGLTFKSVRALDPPPGRLVARIRSARRSYLAQRRSFDASRISPSAKIPSQSAARARRVELSSRHMSPAASTRARRTRPQLPAAIPANLAAKAAAPGGHLALARSMVLRVANGCGVHRRGTSWPSVRVSGLVLIGSYGDGNQLPRAFAKRRRLARADRARGCELWRACSAPAPKAVERVWRAPFRSHRSGQRGKSYRRGR